MDGPFRYAKFALAVQKLAQEVDPDAVVMGGAYVNYNEPPIETKLNDHVIIAIVSSIMYPWTPAKQAQYMIEAEIEASPDHTLLQGLREQPFSTLPETPPTPRVTVTMDDIWLSDYSPARGQKVDLQIQVHNLTKSPVEKVLVAMW